MNKEYYVSLEVAKLLKEKGYDEPCETEVNIYLGTWAYCDYDHIGARNYNLPTNKASYPTLYEAQKWLREKGLFIEIHYYNGDYYMYDILTIPKHDLIGLTDRPYIKYKSYEETLNAGILEALKLI